MARTSKGASAAGSSTTGSSTADSSAAQADLAAAAVTLAITPLLNVFKENALENAKRFAELKERVSALQTEVKEAKESRTPTGVPLVVEEDDVDVRPENSILV